MQPPYVDKSCRFGLSGAVLPPCLHNGGTSHAAYEKPSSWKQTTARGPSPGHRQGPGERRADSCIESTQYIIRSVYRGPTYTWRADADGVPVDTPHVYAVFGGNWYFDISDDDNWSENLPATLADYSFETNEMPAIGEGLCRVKKTPGPNIKCLYDMHFGAVLNTYVTGVSISTNRETPGNVTLGPLAQELIVRLDDFRKTIAGPTSRHFALGKLTVNLPNGARNIRVG